MIDRWHPAAPPWATDGLVRNWVAPSQELPWLPLRPYLVKNERLVELVAGLESVGFRVVRTDVDVESADVENNLLVGLSQSLDLSLLGAGHWSAFADRMIDLKRSDGPPVAVVISGLDAVASLDVYRFTRCVTNLLTITDGLGAQDASAGRQVEYFFVGS